MAKRKRSGKRSRRGTKRSRFRKRPISKKARRAKKQARKDRKERRIERRNKATIIHGRDFTPEAVLMKLRWNTYQIVAAANATAVGTPQFISFCLNSCYDPLQQNQNGAAGTSVFSWTSLAAKYQNYIVRGCKFRFKALPISHTTSYSSLPAQMVWWISQHNSAPAAWSDTGNIVGMKQRWIDVRTFGCTPNPGQSVISRYVNIGKYLKDMNEENDKAATTGTTAAMNPRRPLYLWIGFLNMDDTVTTSFSWSMYMRFYAKFWNKVTEYEGLDNASATTTSAVDYPLNRQGE